MLQVSPVRAFSDNYIWLIRAPADPGAAVVVDPGDDRPVEEALQQQGLRLGAILVTHHHADHVGGVAALVARHGAPVFGPAREKMPCAVQALDDGGTAALDHLGLQFSVMAVPGHTLGHIAYARPRRAVLRRHAVQRGLRPPVRGHGRADARFARPAGRPARRHPGLLRARIHAVQPALRRRGRAPQRRHPTPRSPPSGNSRERDEITLPSTLGRERHINPFLRSREPAVRAAAEQHAGQALPGSRRRVCHGPALERRIPLSAHAPHQTTADLGPAGRHRPAGGLRDDGHHAVLEPAAGPAARAQGADGSRHGRRSPARFPATDRPHLPPDQYADLLDRIRDGYALPRGRALRRRPRGRALPQEPGLPRPHLQAWRALPVLHRQRDREAQPAARTRAAAGGRERVQSGRLFAQPRLGPVAVHPLLGQALRPGAELVDRRAPRRDRGDQRRAHLPAVPQQLLRRRLVPGDRRLQRRRRHGEPRGAGQPGRRPSHRFLQPQPQGRNPRLRAEAAGDQPHRARPGSARTGVCGDSEPAVLRGRRTGPAAAPRRGGEDGGPRPRGRLCAQPRLQPDDDAAQGPAPAAAADPPRRNVPPGHARPGRRRRERHPGRRSSRRRTCGTRSVAARP